jgi:hypothetical protein
VDQIRRHTGISLHLTGILNYVIISRLTSQRGVVEVLIQQRLVHIRVWRRLVARLNGVQEAAGSTPVTRTKVENPVSIDIQSLQDYFMLVFAKTNRLFCPE